MKKMNKKGLGLIAGGIVIAIAAGGTFALWNDSATVAGGEITAGNLDLHMWDTGYWYDMSRTDGAINTNTSFSNDNSGMLVETAGFIEDITSYRMVPGDTVLGDFSTVVSLEGDHALAELEVTTAAGAPLPDGFVVDYLVGHDGEWTTLGEDTDTILFYSIDFNGTPPVGAVLAGQKEFDPFAGDSTPLKIRVYFDAATTGQVSVQETVNLGDVNVTLTQVRAGL